MRLPLGSQFSPSQIFLPRFLQLVLEGHGTQGELENAIEAAFFAGHKSQWRRKLANNTLLAARSYGEFAAGKAKLEGKTPVPEEWDPNF